MNDDRYLGLGERFAGVLFGTAVGDALGLPAENLSPGRIQKLWSGDWQMRFLPGRGMISDDTEHTLMVAQTLLCHPDDPIAFQRGLAWRLRWWFAGLPGGVGLATAKACLKLWIGFPPNKCAVASAGSGPAMRSAILGAYFADRPERRKEFVLAATRLTHRSWQAETAALAVAESVALAMSTKGPPDPSDVISGLRGLSPEDEWQKRLSGIVASLKTGDSVASFAQVMGLKNGVTGYSLHVVPVALFAWLRHPRDFRAALTAALDCGGDTDTVGAIVGALAGSTVGKKGIPVEWLDALWEWPHSQAYFQRIAARLTEQKKVMQPLGPIRYFWPAQILRNAVFLATVLAHGLRRLAPPY